MTTKEVLKTLYIAKDGKEFLTESECSKHEQLLEKIETIKYYKVQVYPDLAKTGNFTDCIYVAVSKQSYLSQSTIVFQWAYDKFGLVGHGVMGYGLLAYFNITPINKDIYFREDLKQFQHVFLSETDVEGFPEKMDMIEIWKKKYEIH